MSIVNVLVDGQRALIASDTRIKAYSPDGPGMMTEGDKLAAFDAARVAVAMRGNFGLFNIFVAQLRENRHPWDIHWFAERGVEMANEASRKHRSMAEAFGETNLHDVPAGAAGSEIFAAGWSARLGRMLGFVLVLQPQGFELVEIPYLCAAPQAHDVWPTPADIPPFDTSEKMAAAAREQVRYFRTLHPDEPIGGRLKLAELTPDGVTVRTVCELG